MTTEQPKPPPVVLSTAQLERFEAWWGEKPVELVPLEPRSAEDTLSAWVWLAWQAATIAAIEDKQAPRADLQQLIAAAVLAEREACAQTCAEMAYTQAMPHHYAHAIRERSNVEVTGAQDQVRTQGAYAIVRPGWPAS
jgi:hypothetical protein